MKHEQKILPQTYIVIRIKKYKYMFQDKEIKRPENYATVIHKKVLNDFAELRLSV